MSGRFGDINPHNMEGLFNDAYDDFESITITQLSLFIAMTFIGLCSVGTTMAVRPTLCACWPSISIMHAPSSLRCGYRGIRHVAAAKSRGITTLIITLHPLDAQ